MFCHNLAGISTNWDISISQIGNKSESQKEFFDTVISWRCLWLTVGWVRSIGQGGEWQSENYKLQSIFEVEIKIQHITLSKQSMMTPPPFKESSQWYRNMNPTALKLRAAFQEVRLLFF